MASHRYSPICFRSHPSLIQGVAAGLLLLPCAVSAQVEQATLEMHIGPTSPVGFYTVEEAHEKLLQRDGLRRSTNDDGWLQLEDRTRNVLWSFVPEDHVAYPSVIRRTVSGSGAGKQINMDALCEARRKDCEKLMKQLRRENAVAQNEFVRMPHRGQGVNSDMTPLGSLMSAAP